MVTCVFFCVNGRKHHHLHVYLHVEKGTLDEQKKSRLAVPRINRGWADGKGAEAVLENLFSPFVIKFLRMWAGLTSAWHEPPKAQLLLRVPGSLSWPLWWEPWPWMNCEPREASAFCLPSDSQDQGCSPEVQPDLSRGVWVREWRRVPGADGKSYAVIGRCL